MTTDPNDLRDRLAKHLEGLQNSLTLAQRAVLRLPATHRTPEFAKAWADRCLTDPAAALALVTEHYLRDTVGDEPEDDPGNFVEAVWFLRNGVPQHTVRLHDCGHIDGVGIGTSEAEALCAAWLNWWEAQR